MVRSEPHSGRVDSAAIFVDPARTVCGLGCRSCGQALGLLVPVSSHTSRCFHLRPINPLVWAGALPH